jgi:hypothetical protein
MRRAHAPVSFKTTRRDMEGEMILRLWRGWTTPENADRYGELQIVSAAGGR